MSLGYYVKERTDEAVNWTYGLHIVCTQCKLESYNPIAAKRLSGQHSVNCTARSFAAFILQAWAHYDTKTVSAPDFRLQVLTQLE